jgi:protein-S-isoprenylcysteine O-methyltransferase Ste14
LNLKINFKKGRLIMGSNLVIVFICLVLTIVYFIEWMKPTTQGWYGVFIVIIFAIAVVVGTRQLRQFGDTLEARFDALEQKAVVSGPVKAGEAEAKSIIEEE